MTGQPPAYQNDNCQAGDAFLPQTFGDKFDGSDIGGEVPPLEIFARSFLKERSIAAKILEISSGEKPDEKISYVRDYLRDIQPQLRRMESDALVPVLKKYSLSDDECLTHIDNAGFDEHLAENILSILENLKLNDCMDPASCQCLRTLAHSLRKRAAIWNAVILPIARVRFNDQANLELSERLGAIVKNTQQENANEK
ncbi:MAG: hypothetical protein HKN14_11100 [Marinicaulis sp.]|nr:hypothetical protein [Marinicaulis sp.]